MILFKEPAFDDALASVLFLILLLSSLLSSYRFLKIYSAVFYYLKLSAYLINLSSLLIEAFNILNCRLSNILALSYEISYIVFSPSYQPKHFLFSIISPSVTIK